MSDEKPINPWKNDGCSMSNLPSKVYRTSGCSGKLRKFNIKAIKTGTTFESSLCALHYADFRSPTCRDSEFSFEEILNA